MYCAGCGRDIGNAKFCPNCGAPAQGWTPAGTLTIRKADLNTLVGAGIDVYVDGRFETSLDGKNRVDLTLPTGSHKVRLQIDGFPDASADIFINPNSTTSYVLAVNENIRSALLTKWDDPHTAPPVPDTARFAPNTAQPASNAAQSQPFPNAAQPAHNAGQPQPFPNAAQPAPNAGRHASHTASTIPAHTRTATGPFTVPPASQTPPPVPVQPAPVSGNAPQSGGITCSRCGSNNVNIQVIQENHGGTTITHTSGTMTEKGHGCLWWLLIGWWWKIIDLCLWLLLFPYRFAVWFLGNVLFPKKHKYKTQSTSISTTSNKIVYKKICTCQNCGNSWRI